ncbi:MAG: hypothetical protein R2748_10825 [Bryobacterales bacterium]
MSKSFVLACAAIALFVGVIAWGCSIDAHSFARWGFVAVVLPAIWAYVEWAQLGDRAKARKAVVRWHRVCFAWAGLMLALSLGFRVGIAAGTFHEDWTPAVLRLRGVVFGASMMLWGNYLPKLPSPWILENQPFDWTGVHRFVGCGAFLGGLAMFLGWLTMPLQDAKSLAQIIVLLTAGLAMGRKWLSWGIPADGAKASCR